MHSTLRLQTSSYPGCEEEFPYMDFEVIHTIIDDPSGEINFLIKRKFKDEDFSMEIYLEVEDAEFIVSTMQKFIEFIKKKKRK